MEDGSDLDVLVDGAVKVVGGAGAVGEMERALALCAAGGEDLVNVDLAAARVPAGAGVVLGCPGDARVQEPEGGHVAVEAAVAVEGHLEVEEEDLVGAGKALVGDVFCAGEAAGLVTLFAREDGEFLVGGDLGVGEDLGGGGAAVALGVEVGEG